jgi:hypothetical protein
MYQKDFILRMIEMLADLIAGILGLIKKGDFDMASQRMERAYTDFLKQDASFFNNIPKEQIVEKLLQEHHYENGHLEILTELFYAEAELMVAKNDQKGSLEFYEKALLLHTFVEKETGTFSMERQTRLSLINGRIAQIKDSNS